MIPISSRKLFRLGLVVAGLMTFLLFYLAYQDIFASREYGVQNKLGSQTLQVTSGLQNDISLSTQNRGHDFDTEYLHESSPKYIRRRPPSAWYQKAGIPDLMPDDLRIQNKVNVWGGKNPIIPDRPTTLDPVDQEEKEFAEHAEETIRHHLEEKFPMDKRKVKKKHLVNNDHDLSVFFGSNFSRPETSQKGPNMKKNKKKVKTRPTNLPFLIGRGSTPLPFNHTKEKTKGYVIYRCDNGTWCGGWGDRQRGIVSTYLLARLTKRKFKIDMLTPCSLYQFYKPNRVQWIIQPGELPKYSRKNLFNTFTNPDIRLELTEGDFNKKFPMEDVYFKSNMDFFYVLRQNPLYSELLSKWPGIQSRSGRFRWAWQDLMTPSSSLLARLEFVLGSRILLRRGLITKSLLTSYDPQPDKKDQVGDATLICAHVRIGKNPTIPMDETFDDFNITDLPILHDFMLSKHKSGSAKFFVATDSNEVRQKSKQYFGDRFIQIGGEIIHIDRQRDMADACRGFESALLDQLVLTVCDVLVVSRSGFSIHAAQLSNVTSPIYVFEKGQISLLTRT